MGTENSIENEKRIYDIDSDNNGNVDFTIITTKTEFNKEIGKENVFYLTYKTTKENEKVNLISNKEYNSYDIKGNEIKHISFYEANKNNLCDESFLSHIIGASYQTTFELPGEHKVLIKMKGNITSLGGMFKGCKNLIKIEGVPGKNIKNFSNMFSECSSLENIDALKKWDVSKGNNFSYMFSICSSLKDT